MTKHKADQCMTENIAKEIGTKVFSTYIRSTMTVEESQALKQDLFSYAPKATVTEDYSDLFLNF